MPNDIDCFLRVFGSAEDVAKFKDDAETKNHCISFQKLVPKEMLEDDGERHREDWAYDTGMKIPTKHCLEYMFSTAWAPPARMLVAVSALYPNLHFSLVYYAMMGGDYGNALLSGGEVVFWDWSSLGPDLELWHHDFDIYGDDFASDNEGMAFDWWPPLEDPSTDFPF